MAWFYKILLLLTPYLKKFLFDFLMVAIFKRVLTGFKRTLFNSMFNRLWKAMAVPLIQLLIKEVLNDQERRQVRDALDRIQQAQTPEEIREEFNRLP